ncbi:MAG: helix-turn-helix domain-containing protein [Lachnospiraceae bacterium]|nr:helix-turn-helix domain-containing protein [Lachnospiraceae bacterium]
MELHKIYRPITAMPFRNNENYMEFEPCDALKPYIRCFWGTKNVTKQEKSDIVVKEIVTPDTCADIIFTVDFTNNKIESVFGAIGYKTLSWYSINNENKTIFSFAIRFYAWGVVAFAEESVKNTKNVFFDVEYHFPKIKKEIEKLLFDVTDMYHLIPKVEKVLLKYFNDKHKNPTVLQAVSNIVVNKGNLAMTNLRQEIFVSERQLERLFDEYVGVSPKCLTSMVRYQCLWSEVMYNKNFNGLDAVYRYGYSDHAHLCHDFKKYHSMSMADARKFALQNVGNIQGACS